jgi:hypothetical protein
VKRRRHSWPERWLFLQAATSLLLARVALRAVPFRALVRVLGMSAGRSLVVDSPSPRERAASIGWAIRAAERRLPGQSTCLSQALAAAALLRLRGMPGTLSLGVGKGDGSGQAMLAHAWMQYGDLVLTGERERAQYAELTTFALPS